MLVSANFGRLVLGCIEADFCNQGLILQHFSRSTRLIYSAPLKIQDFITFFRKSLMSLIDFDNFWNISELNTEKCGLDRQNRR